MSTNSLRSFIRKLPIAAVWYPAALTAVLVGRLAQLESFGVPYLAPFAPGQGKDGYGVLRWPTHRVKFREAILHTRNRRRQG